MSIAIRSFVSNVFFKQPDWTGTYRKGVAPGESLCFFDLFCWAPSKAKANVLLAAISRWWRVGDLKVTMILFVSFETGKLMGFENEVDFFWVGRYGTPP